MRINEKERLADEQVVPFLSQVWKAVMMMKKTIPVPIMNSMIKVFGCCAAMSICGLIVAIASRDFTMFFLSAVILVVGCGKIMEIRRQVSEHDYVVVEGKLLAAHDLGFQKKVKAYIEIPSQGKTILRLHGRLRLKEGHRYRLYLSRPVKGSETWTVPEYLRPAQNVLGYEEMPDEGGDLSLESRTEPSP